MTLSNEPSRDLPFVAVVLLLSVLLASPSAIAAPEGLSGTLDAWTAAESAQSACRQHRPCEGVGLLGVGATFVLRLPNGLAVGAGIDGAAEIWATSHSTWTALAGLSFAPTPRSRLELLAEGGVHEITGVASDLFVAVDGVDSASLPYAGVRLGWTARFGERVRFVVGAWIAARFDLSRETLHLRTQETLFEEELADEDWRNETWIVGGPTAIAALRFGVELR